VLLGYLLSGSLRFNVVILSTLFCGIGIPLRSTLRLLAREIVLASVVADLRISTAPMA
jgi:hypothetical protein